MAPQIVHDQAFKMASKPISSLFPDRPIRPLPKRRLKERLTPEAADSIQYPPAPRSSTSLFSYPYSLLEEPSESGSAPSREVASRHEQRKPQGNEVEGDRKTEDGTPTQGAVSRAALQHANLATRPKLENGRYGDSLALPSAASSADGYDLFENTNNKKRKIPTAGDSAPGGAHAISDSSTGTGSLTSSAQFADGEAGPGGPPSHVQVTGSAEAVCGLDPEHEGTWLTVTKGESTGIISNAIAKAEKLPPHHGQENISLLHQPSSAKRSPASTQFTFTCDSQVPGSLAWPGSDRRMAMPQHAAVNQGKENWPRGPQPAQGGHAVSGMPHVADAGTKEASSRGTHHTAPPQKTSRRSATKEYLAAAKARRRETQLYNKRHPPKPEEMWVCHFCEYEWIFGHPPEALVRSYEIKERKQRQLEEQRRAQWERMKKGKHKGKKNSKLPAKNGNAVQDVHHHADNRAAGDHHYDHGDQGEEYYDDEYYEDEEYDAEEEVAIEHGPGSVGRHADVPGHFGDSFAVHDGGGT
ncbi:uncharacterized protein B0H64DRAFT_415122 [Chaetomium fimeti]|uniref:Uncharacterized protein n=1 Tax=Chaetomium fimeti TaxID=1854472 RepID=A0AAE0LV22_9PEZI|nr:hypothetical protein B0H64DRAFT_415122 [Chaetomium fimeti]